MLIRPGAPAQVVLDLQQVILNEGRLVPGVLSRIAGDATDGRISVLRPTPAVAQVVGTAELLATPWFESVGGFTTPNAVPVVQAPPEFPDRGVDLRGPDRRAPESARIDLQGTLLSTPLHPSARPGAEVRVGDWKTSFAGVRSRPTGPLPQISISVEAGATTGLNPADGRNRPHAAR
jgi:hypothetical protein